MRVVGVEEVVVEEDEAEEEGWNNGGNRRGSKQQMQATKLNKLLHVQIVHGDQTKGTLQRRTNSQRERQRESIHGC